MKKNGFTLIELMIVISMIGIIAAIVVPSIMDVIPGIILKKTSNELMSDFRMARIFAVKRQQRVHVVFDTASHTYRIVANTKNNNIKDKADDDLMLKRVDLTFLKGSVRFGKGPALIDATQKGKAFSSDFDGVTFGKKRFEFHTDGTASGKGYIYITNKEQKRCYAIGIPYPSGLLKMRISSGKEWKTL